MSKETYKGIVLGVVSTLGVLLWVSVAYASGGLEPTQLINDTDNKTTKVCKMDCQIRYYCENQTWCNTLTEQGTCEYIEVEE